MFISPFQGYLNGRFHILNVIVFRDQPNWEPGMPPEGEKVE
jgi:hypothetical protein